MRTDIEHSLAPGEQRPTGERTGAAISNIATLLPARVPGRLTRKARHYLPQILQLRARGYTLEAIQRALAAVGVAVSISTVRREAMRPLPPALVPVVSTGTCAQTLATPPPAAPAPSTALRLTPGFPDSGKDTAAAFAQSKSSNLLTRAKERS